MMKSYKKESDIHYALSENELLIEIRDPSSNKVHRFCKTLFKEIDVDQSSIELLVDFVACKLKKRDKEITWEQGIGYDVKEFTLPKRGQMKSNFLKYIKPIEEESKKEEIAEDQDTNKENL